MDKKKYTTGVMIGNAISPHIVELIEGIYRASADMQINVFFFLGIHSGYYYNLSKECSVDKDFDYQFNVVYDYQAFTRIDALIIEYGSLSLFLNKKEQKNFLKKFNNIPKVILEDRYTNPGTTSIISDNYNGMYTLVEHLIKNHGYRSFTCLAGPEGITDADERKKAIWDAMKKYHIPFNESRIRYGNFSSNAQTQVNDVFGHAEGDFAIKYCGETLNKIAGEKGIVGRIGGDKFCILIPGDANMGEIFIEQIFSANNTFNLHSDKPYYVEFSIVYTQIVCEKDLLIAEEMKAADLALYEVKKRRRESVRK